MKTIINLTPHKITLPKFSIEPSGTIARCEEVTANAGFINGVEIITRKYGNVTGLPDEQRDTFYIVSLLVRQALPKRKDLLSPGDLVRDDNGMIIGAKNLVMND